MNFAKLNLQVIYNVIEPTDMACTRQFMSFQLLICFVNIDSTMSPNFHEADSMGLARSIVIE